MFVFLERCKLLADSSALSRLSDNTSEFKLGESCRSLIRIIIRPKLFSNNRQSPVSHQPKQRPIFASPLSACALFPPFERFFGRAPAASVSMQRSVSKPEEVYADDCGLTRTGDFRWDGKVACPHSVASGTDGHSCIWNQHLHSEIWPELIGLVFASSLLLLVLCTTFSHAHVRTCSLRSFLNSDWAMHNRHCSPLSRPLIINKEAVILAHIDLPWV